MAEVETDVVHRTRSRSPLLALVVAAAVGLTQVTTSCSETDRDDILTKGEKLYSQNDEELIIRHFFDDRRDGFFLDVGAFDWKKASTTLYLERHLGWSDIAIDAQEKYAQGYEKNRPQTKFFTYLVTDHSGDFGTLYAAGPLSSVSKDNVKFFPEVKDFKPKPIQVATITLDDLLERNEIETIDFLSMDIEGAEPMALAGFDIERFRPALVCIEVPGGPARGDNRLFSGARVRTHRRVSGARPGQLVLQAQGRPRRRGPVGMSCRKAAVRVCRTGDFRRARSGRRADLHQS
jgi:FkbM family methyltransferase